MISVERVTGQLRSLGVRPGSTLLVHTSYRAVGPVEDGPLGLIDALTRALGETGTLVMPTMTDGESVFDPTRTPSSGMGITAELFWRQPGVVRSGHPGGSFAARGPEAERICAPQPLSPPHGPDSPPGRVLALDGRVLLLGTTHGENTTLHVAESLAGVPYSVEHPCVVSIDGVVKTIAIAETDHCCRGFGKLDAPLDARGLQRRGTVGHGQARLVASRDLVDAALAMLARDALALLCDDATCEECAAARRSVKR